MKKKVILLASLALLIPMMLFAQGGTEKKVAAEKADTTISIIAEWSSDTPTSTIFREDCPVRCCTQWCQGRLGDDR